jgi:hypothetical protein
MYAYVYALDIADKAKSTGSSFSNHLCSYRWSAPEVLMSTPRHDRTAADVRSILLFILLLIATSPLYDVL